MSNSAVKSSMRHLSMLGAWALAFGCAVGSDAFVMPWNDFLPKAGPLGTVLGIFIGSLIMTIVAWNFHYMMNRQPGPGGTYAYASAAFGHDHGFLCGVFLAFAYLAIVWLDVTALVVVAHYTLGDTFRFGFRYTIHDQPPRGAGVDAPVFRPRSRFRPSPDPEHPRHRAVALRRLRGHFEFLLGIPFLRQEVLPGHARRARHGGDRLHVPDVHPRAHAGRRGLRLGRRRGRLGQFRERAGLPRV